MRAVQNPVFLMPDFNCSSMDGWTDQARCVSGSDMKVEIQGFSIPARSHGRSGGRQPPGRAQPSYSRCSVPRETSGRPMIFMCKPSASVLVPLSASGSGRPVRYRQLLADGLLHVARSPDMVGTACHVQDEVRKQRPVPYRGRSVARSRRRRKGAEFNLSSRNGANRSRNDPRGVHNFAMKC